MKRILFKENYNDDRDVDVFFTMCNCERGAVPESDEDAIRGKL